MVCSDERARARSPEGRSPRFDERLDATNAQDGGRIEASATRDHTELARWRDARLLDDPLRWALVARCGSLMTPYELRAARCPHDRH